jgi:anaerobic ribonucleoside-triphosphate reductase
MFRCNHCHIEYGGIRGLAGATCPRCRPKGKSVKKRPAEKPARS